MRKKLLVIILPLLCYLSVCTGQERWRLTGLKESYKLCDSISFTIDKAFDSCNSIVMIGAETIVYDKWVLFAEDIFQPDPTMKAHLVTVFDNGEKYNKHNTVAIAWNPCKFEYLMKPEHRPFLKGQFRFVIRENCNNCHYRIMFHSDPFVIQ